MNYSLIQMILRQGSLSADAIRSYKLSDWEQEHLLSCIPIESLA
jgi:hypothetical protein